MKNDYEWYVNGKRLYGDKAKEYLEKKMKQLLFASKNVDEVLKRCKSYNAIKNSKSLSNSVMETAENLSLIELELETLIEELRVILD